MAKNVIFYFSGTGNSLAVARGIAEKLGDTDIISISSYMKNSPREGWQASGHSTRHEPDGVFVASVSLDLSSSERIGIVFPVYMWGLPLIVRRFLENCNFSSNSYIFAVATYGGSCGVAFDQICGIFDCKGLKLASEFGFLMPGNYIPLYPISSDKKLNKLFIKTDKSIEEISKKIESKEQAKLKKMPWIGRKFFAFIYKKMSPHIPEAKVKFFVDERCDSCGVCEKVCPVCNIKLIDGRPVWDKKCEQCLACLHWCPKEAIQFGNSTSKRKRYHHPSVALKDFLK